MNNKRILQTIGIFFILITTSVSSKEEASGQSKNNSTKIDNLKRVEIYARATAYPPTADAETENGKTASLIPIEKVTSLGLECIAVNPEVIPYGSFIIGKDKEGNTIQGVAVDTGEAVKSRRAAINLAEKKGYSDDSPQAKALVLDFYSNKGEMTKAWDTFTVIVYNGPCFKLEMNQSEKLKHIINMKSLYGKKA